VLGGDRLTTRSASPWLWLGLGIAACAVTWVYVHRILLRSEYTVNVTYGPLKTQLGDLYPRWVGTRELLLNHRDPYGPEVSQEIQIAFYGHALHQSYDNPGTKVLDEQRFVYPVYVVLLLAPTVHVDFDQLNAWAPVLLAALTAISVLLWLRVLRWRPPPVFICAMMLFILASPQIAQGLRLRQFGLLVAFLIALASWCAVNEHYFLAGTLLALSTIKPQMVVLVILLFLMWSLADVRKRWALPAGFGVCLLILVGAGEVLLPGWPHSFLQGLQAYRRYFPTTSPIRLLLGDWVGGAVSIVLLLGLLAYGWRRRKVPSDSPKFVETLAVFLLATCLVLPLFTPYNQVLLLLVVLTLLRDWSRLPRLGRLGFIAVVSWPWLVSLVLLAYGPSVDSPSHVPLLPAVAALLFPFLIAGLMFARPAHADELPPARA
jgi:hypothetical protein